MFVPGKLFQPSNKHYILVRKIVNHRQKSLYTLAQAPESCLTGILFESKAGANPSAAYVLGEFRRGQNALAYFRHINEDENLLARSLKNGQFE